MTRAPDADTPHFDDIVALESAGDGVFTHDLDGTRTNLIGTLYGGYTMAVTLQALAAATPDREMVSATCQFIRTLPAERATIAVEDIRVGRTVAAKSAECRVGDRLGVRATALFTPMPADGGTWDDPVPALPPIEDCVDPFERGGLALPFMWPATLRVPAEVEAQLVAGNGDRPEAVAWSGYGDADGLTGPRLAGLADRFVPPPWLLGQHVGLLTLELSFHLLRPGTVGWLATRFTTPTIGQDLVTLESTYWDDRGRVVATARQIARPMPVDLG